jgi:hypothetical protein
MYRKIKVSVGVVPMLLAENRIPNTFCPQGIISSQVEKVLSDF